MSKKKKSKKENQESADIPESVWPINEKMINPEVVCLYGPPKDLNEKLKSPSAVVKLYGPPKDLPCKKSKKTKNEKDDKEK